MTEAGLHVHLSLAEIRGEEQEGGSGQCDWLPWQSQAGCLLTQAAEKKSTEQFIGTYVPSPHHP